MGRGNYGSHSAPRVGSRSGSGQRSMGGLRRGGGGGAAREGVPQPASGPLTGCAGAVFVGKRYAHYSCVWRWPLVLGLRVFHVAVSPQVCTAG